jgi:hypothetical protein
MKEPAKAILICITTTALNIALSFLLILILADGILKYETGFYILLPFITSLTSFVFYFLYIQTKKFKAGIISSLSYSWTIAFVFINLIILILNYSCWIDLFDGTTKLMI